MIMVGSAAGDLGEEERAVAVVVTAAKGYDLGYVWKNQAHQAGAEKAIGGYYISAAQAGEPPGRWWGPGAEVLGLAAGQAVQRGPYDAVYQQRGPATGEKLGRSRGSYLKFADHLARLQAVEPRNRGAADRAGAGGSAGDPPARRLHRCDRVVFQVDLGATRFHQGKRPPRPSGR
jgi:hypothetical protein